MKKGLKITLIMCLIIAIGLFLIAKFVNASKIVKEENILKNASMIIKDNTLTNNGCKVIITDTEKEEIHTYGNGYRIDKKENNKWVYMKPKKDIGFTMNGYRVKEDNKLEMDINWSNVYGNLKPGHYRLVKSAAIQMNNQYKGDGVVYTEFTIE